MNHSATSRPAQLATATAVASLTRQLPLATRTRVSLLGALLLVGSIGTALAQDAPTVKAKQGDSQSLLLTITNPAQQRMQMQVIDAAGRMCLVNEVNHRASYGSTLNFNGVPAGQYAVLLRVGKEHYRYDVQVASQPKTSISVPGLTPPNASGIVASVAR